MLRALVLQLSNQLKGPHMALTRLYDSYRHATPPNETLLDCLHQLVLVFRDVYIILDALDESPRNKHRQVLLHVLNDIRA